MVDGELRFRSDPPLLVPVRELLYADTEAEALQATIHESLRQYRRTLPGDRRASSRPTGMSIWPGRSSAWAA